uniref:gamma-glutamyl hydrolase-like n=1 Tax=Pristiophorus japonicus TaxID=55135 RepID=UPI00398F640F
MAVTRLAVLLCVSLSLIWDRLSAAPLVRLNQRPIIGVLAEEASKDLIQFGNSFIAASYVKFLESAGARVVPISIKLTDAEYQKLFHSINGLFFLGTVVLQTSRYTEILAIFYNLALKVNDEGNHFPVLATCIGFEELTFITSGRNLLTKTDTFNLALPLNFTKDVQDSRMFKNFPKYLLHDLQVKPLTGHFHNWSITTQNFTKNKNLKNFYRILSTNMDSQQVEFVSSMEGVLAQETYGNLKNFGGSYIATSYVKYLESAGARVVPISINLLEAEYRKLFYSINGVLLPGGGANLITSRYAKIAALFYNLTLQANDHGTHFPVWGTCLGFEELTVLTSGEKLLIATKTSDLSLPLKFTKDAVESQMFKNFPGDLMQALAVEPLTANFHHWSITVKNFTSHTKLRNFFKILSTNIDSQELEFVSTMEARSYPIYGVQWHPEKNPYEWRIKNIPHSHNAVKVAWYMADFFVNEARKNSHYFSDETEEANALIYNYAPVYTGNISNLEQMYFIDDRRFS